MRKKPKLPPRLLDRGAIRLKGWTANKVAAIKAKREAAKGKTA
jgi:hypothetical protein